MGGAVTAAYQIEGGYNEGGKGESIWDRLCKIPGNIFNNENGNIACDNYRRYKDDIRLIADIGLQAYRFSISWPRIFPNGTGKINHIGLSFYDKLVDELLTYNITPFITLYHWDLPQALEDKGGWRNKETSYAMAEYAKVVVKELSDRVANWITLNEIPCIASGYRSGMKAPGAKEPAKIVNQVIHNCLLAHGLCVRAIREAARQPVKIGLAHNGPPFIPGSESPEDREAAQKAWYEENSWMMDPIYKGKYPQELWKEKGEDVSDITAREMNIINTPTDFFGLNLYSGSIVKKDTLSFKGYKLISYPKNYLKTAMDWPINPACIYWLLRYLKEYYNIAKFYIIENGCAFDDIIAPDGKIHDEKRIDYIKNHLISAHRAISEGINLAGYFAWSLIWFLAIANVLGLYILIITRKREF